MRILVTGGAGFVGSHLSRKLISEGHEIIAVDNFYTGSRSNVADLLTNPSFELIRHDITQPFYAEVDAVMNLACPASPVHYQKHPVQTTKTSVIGTTNMLGLAKRLNVPILQASTSEVYGDPNISPQSEDYWGNVNPIGIRACYDEGKRVAETLCFDYIRQYDVQAKVVRIFNTYGPNMQFNDGRVVSNFILQALTNSDITIYGDGSQTRSFCYVSDLVDGLIKMIFSQKEVTGPINLGNPAEMSILQLAEKIIALTNSRSKIIREPLPSDDPKQRKPDISIASKVLQWHPKVSLDEGLKATIQEFENRLKNGSQVSH
jgi:UDP-glucuronate decarboxylase